MITRTLMVAVVGVCLVVGSGGCRPKNTDGTTMSAQAKPKRTWWGLGPPKKEQPETYSMTTAQEPKPKRTWFGLGPPKKAKPAAAPTVAQAPAPEPVAAPAHTQVPAARPAPAPAPAGAAAPENAPAAAAAARATGEMNRSSRFKSAARTEPREATVASAGMQADTAVAPKREKRGWFGWGSRKDSGPAYVAQGERVETDMAEAVEIDVLANEGADRRDLDLDKIITGPSHGSARIRQRKNAAGQEMQTIVYTPRRGFSGDDRIRYRVERGSEKSQADALVHVRRRGVLKIGAAIDHKDVIMIRGNELWFRNMYGMAPAEVTVNGRSVELGYGEERQATTGDSKKVRFAPSMPSDRASNVSATGGPDAEAELVIVEQPTAENNYTTVLMLSDPREGMRKWDVEVRFDAE